MLEAINRVMDIALKHQATLLHASISEVYGDALASASRKLLGRGN